MCRIGAQNQEVESNLLVEGEMKLYLPLGLLTIISIFVSYRAKAADLTVNETTNHVVLWNQTALQAVRNTRFGRPMTARALKNQMGFLY